MTTAKETEIPGLGRPVLMVYHGKVNVPFYGIGDLARALNRSPGTIRKWHTAGIIPPPGFGRPTAALGGRVRLYSRDQIKAARQIAAEEGILRNTAAAVTKTNFKARLAKVWKP
jgi:MerR HTH family regulatory protein